MTVATGLGISEWAAKSVGGSSGAWAGLCNTQFWVDRTSGVCGSIYSNFLPFVTPEAMTMYNDFERALYASL